MALQIQEENKLEKYAMQEVIGSGAYGSVYRAICLKDMLAGRQVAIKIIDGIRIACADEADRATLTRERDVFVAMRSKSTVQKYLVQCYSMFSQNNSQHFVLQLGMTDLEKVIKNFKLNNKFIEQAAAQMVCALESLHILGYSHRDIKPSNFLISRDGSLLLTDFGTAKPLSADEKLMITGEKSYYQMKLLEKFSTVDDAKNPQPAQIQRKTSLVGTISYAAPETIGKQQSIYAAPVDVWGLGCILYEMATGMPFMTGFPEHGKRNRVEQAKKLNTIQSVPLRSFVNRCLMLDPHSRFDGGWPALKQHQFFKSFNWDDMDRFPLINTIKMLQIMKESIKSGYAFKSAPLPVLTEEQMVLYTKLKPYLLEHEIVEFGVESQILLNEKQLNGLIGVTDLRRLIIQTGEAMLEEELVVNQHNLQFSQEGPAVRLKFNLIHYSVDVLILQAGDFYSKLTDCFRQVDKQQCPSCRAFAMTEDICGQCGFQLPFTHKQSVQLKLRPEYFQKQTENMLDEGAAEGCSTSVYLQRKNQFRLDGDQLGWLFQQLEAGGIQDGLIQKAISQPRHSDRPDLIKFTSEQLDLRRLISRIYFPSRRALELPSSPLPRVDILVCEINRDAALEFIEKLVWGIIRVGVDVGGYQVWEDVVEEKHIDVHEFEAFGCM